jgi:hypothetical protein
VTSSSLRGVVVWNNLVPLLRLEVEGVHVVESDTLVVKSSMASEQVDLLVVKDGS